MAAAQAIPAAVQTELPQAQLLGATRLRMLGFNIYDAKLFTTPGFNASRYEEGSFALELTYLRNFKGEAIAERSIKEMRDLGSFTEAQAQDWLAQLKTIVPDVKAGDSITGIYKAGQTATLLHNGKPVGQLRDAQLARLFFGIWLSPRTSQPAMRAQLIAEGATKTP